MPDRAVGASQGQRRDTGQRAFLDEKLAHRHHFPVDLVALRAAVVVQAGFFVGVELADRERAPLIQASRRSATLGVQSNFSAAFTVDVVRSKQAAMSFWPSVTK